MVGPYSSHMANQCKVKVLKNPKKNSISLQTFEKVFRHVSCFKKTWNVVCLHPRTRSKRRSKNEKIHFFAIFCYFEAPGWGVCGGVGRL